MWKRKRCLIRSPSAILLVGILLPALYGKAQVLKSDSLALVALYNATDGPNWTKSDNWLTGPVSTWYEITVAGNRVTEIRFLANQLTGEIPAELGNLSNLESLYIIRNSLEGPIPAELGNLSTLKTLHLSYSELTGPIPASLGSLTSLTTMNLRGNNLSGAIPEELSNLSELTGLLLNKNQLTGVIPSEFGNLASLRYLDLSNNQLSGVIPADLGSLDFLNVLNLSQNQHTGDIPPELGNTGLINLILSGNQLSGAIPAELGSLSFLMTLDIANNQLTGPIPAALGNLVDLIHLYVQHNQLEGTLPHELVNLSALIHFTFSDTGLCESARPAFQNWLAGIAEVESTDCVDPLTAIPTSFALYSNYPNPFSRTTIIRFDLPQEEHVRLTVYNILGQEVACMIDEMKEDAIHFFRLDASTLPSGIYFYTLTAGDFTQTRKMTILQ